MRRGGRILAGTKRRVPSGKDPNKLRFQLVKGKGLGIFCSQKATKKERGFKCDSREPGCVHAQQPSSVVYTVLDLKSRRIHKYIHKGL